MKLLIFSAFALPHQVSAFIINGIHKDCDWAGKLWIELWKNAPKAI